MKYYVLMIKFLKILYEIFMNLMKCSIMISGVSGLEERVKAKKTTFIRFGRQK